MVFRKFFGRAQPVESATPAPHAHDAEDIEETVDEAESGTGVPDDDPHWVEDTEPEGGAADLDPHWRARAADAIPGGASTGSKRPAALFGDDDEEGPTHFARAAGCHVVTAGGDALIDCTMALGAVAIGYADEAVTRAAAAAMFNGHVSALSPTGEVELAERLAEVIPCAELVRFLKTGAEGVAAAVRIARTYTGRDRVVGSGYFGWLDWSNRGTGIPSAANAGFESVPFDDVAALEAAAGAAGRDLAAIVIEPVVERFPSKEWIEAARRLSDDLGAVLIFDEMKTGFRLRPGGYQEYGKVHPDLAVFGKALANGFPLSAVVGRADVMDAARQTWISSTLASEGVSIAAALAVLDWHERAEVCDTLWKTGEEMQGAVQRAVQASGVAGVRIDGIAPMWLLRFDEAALEAQFLRVARLHGVLFKRGAYNFSSLAHDDESIAEIEAAASSALVAIAEDAGRGRV